MKGQVSSDTTLTFLIKFLIYHVGNLSIILAYSSLEFWEEHFHISVKQYELEILSNANKTTVCCSKLLPLDMCSSRGIWQLHLVLRPSVSPANSKWIFPQSPTHLRRWKPPAVPAHPQTYPTSEGGTGPACCLDDQMWCPVNRPDRQNGRLLSQTVTCVTQSVS